MTTPVVFPDAVAHLIGHLRAELPSYGYPDPTVVSRVPNPRPRTFVLCRRDGGTSTSVVLDRALVTIETWAPTAEDAHDLAQIVRALVHALAGTSTIGHTVEAAGPAYFPDPESDHERYVQAIQIQHRGHVLTPNPQEPS